MTQSTSKTEDTGKKRSCLGGCFKWGCLLPTLSILVLALFATMPFGILSFCLDVPVGTLVTCAIHGIDVRTVAPIKKKTVMLPGGVPLELVWVPAGTFTTNDLALSDDEPATPAEHIPKRTCEITISRGFWIGRYEFTQKQWAAVLNEKAQYAYYPDCPIEWVSWHRVQNCLDVLNEMTGEAFRLPTSAEWEHAYRAGTTTRFYWGNQPDSKHLYMYKYFVKNSSYSCLTAEPVGIRLPNAWGVYDMAGNVKEWCQDGFYELMELDCPAVDPVGPGMRIERTVRGNHSANSARAVLPNKERSLRGFRVVLPEKVPLSERKDTAQ